MTLMVHLGNRLTMFCDDHDFPLSIEDDEKSFWGELMSIYLVPE